MVNSLSRVVIDEYGVKEFMMMGHSGEKSGR